MSLRDFVAGVGAAESELAARRHDIASKFAEALSLARPLASVNDQAMQRVHPGQQMEYRYKFSEVPFAGQPVADALAEVLAPTRGSTGPPRRTSAARCPTRTA